MDPPPEDTAHQDQDCLCDDRADSRAVGLICFPKDGTRSCNFRCEAVHILPDHLSFIRFHLGSERLYSAARVPKGRDFGLGNLSGGRFLDSDLLCRATSRRRRPWSGGNMGCSPVNGNGKMHDPCTERRGLPARHGLAVGFI